MFWMPNSWSQVWIPWICAAITGWSGAMMGFYLLHDGCHASFTKSPATWNLLRRVYESFTGLNTLIWIYQHGLGHHPYTNVIGADPDIISDDPGLLRVHEEQPWWNHYGWQKWYWLPVYSQLILSRKLTEYKQVFIDGQYKHIKINPPQLREYFWSVAVLVSFRGGVIQPRIPLTRAVNLCLASLSGPILLPPRAIATSHRIAHRLRPHMVSVFNPNLPSIAREQRSRLAQPLQRKRPRLETIRLGSPPN
jgi:fatty acid desaturase